MKFIEENFHVKIYLSFLLFHVQNQLRSTTFLIVTIAQPLVKKNKYQSRDMKYFLHQIEKNETISIIHISFFCLKHNIFKLNYTKISVGNVIILLSQHLNQKGKVLRRKVLIRNKCAIVVFNC